MIEFAKWPAPDNIVAGVTHRQVGSSHGVFAENNLSYDVGDSAKAVSANRAQLSGALDSHLHWFWLKQVHGIDALFLPCEGDLVGDASFSLAPLHVCGVMTADCLPILLCDTEGQFVAAIHAGWRGLAAGVIENTIHAVKQKCRAERICWKGSNVLAWLGPAISSRHFEVGDDVRQAFVNNQPEANKSAFIKKGNDKYFADISQLAAIRLQTLGIDQIYSSNACTYAAPEKYYSYRRDGQTGRQLSFIYRKN